MSEKSEILKYIMHTPENTNPAIVKSMMEGMNESEVWDTTISGITSGSGDINFKYNGELLGSLSDSGTAVLKTEMTICEHDIELEYTKPETNYTRRLTINGNDNNDWHFRIANLEPIVDQGFITTWDTLGSDIVVLTGDAEKVGALVESRAGAEGSKTHPYNVTGNCVISYNRTKGTLVLNPNANTFEITIVATNE